MFISKKRFQEEIEKARIEAENKCFERREYEMVRSDIYGRISDIEKRLSKIEENMSTEAIKLSEPLVFPDMKGVRHV